uniref:IRG-type G domain-containing protein n=1 Tax=Sphenodon punctatus TaxID=8508 RepID=A0A8D0HJX4_SPHPU
MGGGNSKEERGKPCAISPEDLEKLDAGKISPCDIENLKAVFETGDLSGVAAKLQEKLASKTTLNIAITGASGAGKSSFVNAIRGVSDGGKDAAETGIEETTMQVKPYPHPQLPDVTVWDLPGIGTPKFNAKQYLKTVHFSRYDFFIIISSERFKDHDVQLAQAIRGMKKQFYYVRSKVDNDVKAVEKQGNHNVESVLDQMRTTCIKKLREAGEPSPRVFLISSWDLWKFDFPFLQETLAKELDDQKRHVFMLALPNISKEILRKKKAALQTQVWQMASVSCAGGLVPLPGVSLLCDIATLVSNMVHFCIVLGLDDNSLTRLANQVGKPFPELRSAVKKTPMAGNINKEYVISLLSKSLVCGAATVAELVLDFVPLLGSVAGGGLSFASTYWVLSSFLNDSEEDAQNVLAKSLEP